jgi:ASC-1-like (ASCH) protein
MADYEQVTKDIREGLSKITENKEGKSVEVIMKEILAVLTMACEQNNINKFEFLQAFYEWYREKRSRQWGAVAERRITVGQPSV